MHRPLTYLRYKSQQSEEHDSLRIDLVRLRAKCKGLLPAISVAFVVGLSACGGDSSSGPDNSSVYPSTLVPASNP